MALNNTTNITAERELEQIALKINLYISPVLYIVGFPGNILSLVIWLQKRMQHSSGCYLAALALDDLIFLALHTVYELNIWGVSTVNYPVVCESLPILFIASQILSPFLVLAFTTERYISICHPFKREKYCTIRRAKMVIICLVAAMPCLTAIHGYLWKYNQETGICNARQELTVGKTSSLYVIYSTSLDTLAFLAVPVSVLVLNVLVIREMRRLSQMDTVHLHGSAQRTGATTVMLLAVSFYQIITTLPISIVYMVYLEYNCSPEKPCLTEQERFTSDIYNVVKAVIDEYGITHYAFNFFIYVCTGKMFRQELRKLVVCPIQKLLARLPTNYTSLRNGTRGSEQSRTWMSVNGNQDTERTTDETLL